MTITIVSAIIICFLVGFGCFEWGKSHKESEIFKQQSLKEQEKQKENYTLLEQRDKQYHIEQMQYSKDLKLIKKCLNTQKLPYEKIYCIGVYAMLKEKYSYIPDEKTILHFLKINVLDKIKKQD